MTQLKSEISALFEQDKLAFSDIHIEVGAPLSVRVPRGILPVSGANVVTRDDLLDFLRPFAESGASNADDWQRKIDDKGGQFTARFKIDEASLRAALFNTGGGTGRERKWGLALRVLPEAVPEFETVGLPNELLPWFRRPSGLMFYTGVTGSGKSTAMAAGVGHLNATKNSRIIMLEDPIEFVHKNNRSLISQRELGADFTTFELGVKQAMRQDPDVIVVGEVNDLASMKAVVAAALSGHLVMTSLHTNTAAETINRIIDFYPSDEKGAIRSVIAQLLIGVVSQKLLPSLDGSRRYLAHEIMEANTAVRTLIREDNVQQLPNAINMKRPTMHLMNTSLAMLMQDGKIDEETAMDASYEPEQLRRNLDARYQDDSGDD